MSLISKKICIIGESEVGKNSLIRRFVDRQFSDEYLSTVGVQISRKTLELQGINPPYKLNLQLLIWSITGHPRFKAIAPTYLQGSIGAIAVADLTRPETTERLPEFIIVALNKCDLLETEQRESLIQLNHLEQVSEIYLTSAKTGSYVDEIFLHIAYKILESCGNGFSLYQTSPELNDFSNLTTRGEENRSFNNSDAEPSSKALPKESHKGRGEENQSQFLFGLDL